MTFKMEKGEGRGLASYTERIIWLDVNTYTSVLDKHKKYLYSLSNIY